MKKDDKKKPNLEDNIDNIVEVLAKSKNQIKTTLNIIKETSWDRQSHKKRIWKPAWKDTKALLKKGNIFILAIGVVIGTTFGAVVSSLSKNVILASVAKTLNLSSIEELKSSSGIEYGIFLANLISFLVIIMLSFLFLIITFVSINFLKEIKRRKKLLRQGELLVSKPLASTESTEELILKELKMMNQNLEKVLSQKNNN